MKAIVITRPGGPDVLELREVARPEPGTGEVLVRVRATALNRADLMQREGRYPPPPGAPADIPGLEFAGEVAALGPRAREWREGDRVFGITGGGSYAEYLVAHERTLAPVPASLSWDEAAAVPEAFITANDALVTQAAVRASERVLIHAIGSGVGLAASQLARAFGAVPFGTSRTADKIARAREFGLEDGIALGGDTAALGDAVSRWTGGHGIDVVLDLVGGSYVAAGIEALAPRGRLILIGTVAGAQTELDLRRILTRRLTIRGTVLRARPLEEKILATRAFAAEVVPLLARGAVCPVIDSTFDLADVADAHRHLESNATFGKVVVRVSSG
ncbi:MAG: NAD(P)H-quinone oxidoreductase [Gemmatimonadaceae bacterium]